MDHMTTNSIVAAILIAFLVLILAGTTSVIADMIVLDAHTEGR